MQQDDIFANSDPMLVILAFVLVASLLPRRRGR